jgi:hypothetical protein
MLDIDQSVLTHDPAIPQRIRGQEMAGREKRSILADDAEAVRDSFTRNPKERAVVVRRALDRHQATGMPDLFGFVFKAERSQEHDLNRDTARHHDQKAKQRHEVIAKPVPHEHRHHPPDDGESEGLIDRHN